MKTSGEIARMEFAEQLKKYRGSAGISQAKLAKGIGKQQPYIVAIEKGEYSIGMDIIAEISAYFGMKSYEFSNPAFPVPSRDDLRRNIKEFVNANGIDTGHLIDDISPNYAKNIDKYLATGMLREAKTSIQIAKDYSEIFNTPILPSKVTDILTRPPRNKMVTIIKSDTGRGNKYILIKKQ